MRRRYLLVNKVIKTKNKNNQQYNKNQINPSQFEENPEIPLISPIAKSMPEIEEIIKFRLTSLQVYYY